MLMQRPMDSAQLTQPPQLPDLQRQIQRRDNL